VRIVSEDEVRQHLHPAALIRALELAFRDRYPRISIPARVQIPMDGGVFLIMPCHDRERGLLGAKFVSVLGRSDADLEGSVQATFLLFDPVSTRPRVLIPAGDLTEIRTAATSALATKFLARNDATTLGIFGTGRQARAHLRVMPLVRNFRRVLVCARNKEQARTFCEEMLAASDLPLLPVDANECASESDVICTCTTSSAPLFDGKHLRPGTHLNLVGAFQPQSREVDSAVVAAATVVVDTYQGALAEAGDLLVPLAEGVIDRDHLKMDLHELLSANFRLSSGEITVFKSVGCALEDLVAAELLEENLSLH